jgi:GH24 family phage-related lysozyme (muramidase)
VRQAVADAFPAFTESDEGRVASMYQDVKGLVTVADGDLVDPISLAMNLPWCHGGNPSDPADDAAIIAGWEAVKAMPPGLSWKAYVGATDLRLTPQAIDQLVRTKCNENEATLAQRIPNWALLPADAQLGVLSMAWACGPWFDFPKFMAALKVADFATCAVECKMSAQGNPGLVPRNAQDQRLFEAAAQAALGGWDFDKLYGWP